MSSVTHRSCCFLVTFLASLAFCAAQNANRPPNIILIVSDDQGFHLSTFGDKQYPTPNLDRMAAEGVRGTNFYVTASVCTPSRSGLITGRYPQRNGTYEMIRNDMVNYGHRYTPSEYAMSPEMTIGLDVREKTFGDMLRTAGYNNAAFGKWDMGQAKRFLPLQRGFDYFYGHGNNGIDYYTHERYGAPSMFRNNEVTTADKGMYATDLFRREALSFIRDDDKAFRQGKDRPFFIYLPFNAPHGASTIDQPKFQKQPGDAARAKGAAKAKAGKSAPSPSTDVEGEGVWASQVPDSYLKKYHANRDPNDRITRVAGMVSAMDEAIGDIFKTLRELKLDRNTLVIFFTDNGMGNSVLDGVKLRGGKGSAYEGGLRSPLIAWWPGVIPAGTVTHEFLTSLEVLPTLAAASGAFLPDVHLDGFNMLPVLQGKEKSSRTEMFWDWPSTYQAARVGQYKWVASVPRGNKDNLAPKEELFDLAVDLAEKNDLAKQKPEVLAQVKARFARWRAEMDAAEPRGPFQNY